mgnify:CR=1 FL=1
MSLVLLIAMFSDTVDDIEMRTKERLEGTVFSFRSLVNKVSIAVFNVVMLNIVNFVGYEATKMAQISQDYTIPLITSTTQASVIDGTNTPITNVRISAAAPIKLIHIHNVFLSIFLRSGGISTIESIYEIPLPI